MDYDEAIKGTQTRPYMNGKGFSLYRSMWDKDEESKADALTVAQTITEAIHQDFDGWTDQEKAVIEKFLDDLAMACWYDREMRRSEPKG